MRKSLLFLVALLITASLWAQSPQKFTYQAVIRNSANALVANHAVGVKISILKGTTPVYVETQTRTTNANGLVTLIIGEGTVVSGAFSTIDWANGAYDIKTETDPLGGTAYSITGTSPLLSVPYALNAEKAKTLSGTIPSTQVSDFNAAVAANPAVAANTAKNTYPAADAAKVANLSGINTGDQNLTGLVHTNRAALDLVTGTNTGDQVLPTLSSLGGVAANAAITGATKTKLTYDAKGLVTAGSDATTADIAPSTNRNYVTDAQLVVVGNTSNTNSGDETAATIKSKLGITTLSGSNTGDQTISLTGDVTGSGTGSVATTLSNTPVVPGTYGGFTTTPWITVDSKGRITNIVDKFIYGVSPVGSFLPTNHIFIGDLGNMTAEVPMTGDVHISYVAGNGVTLIQPKAVTYNKIQDVNGERILGNSAASPADVMEIGMSGVPTSLVVMNENSVLIGNTTAVNLQLSGTLGVTGASTLTGNTTVGGTLGVTGHTTLTTLTGTSTATLSSLGVTGNTTVGGNLGVTGTSTLTGNTTIGGTLGVTGATTLASTLGVAGIATFAVPPVITAVPSPSISSLDLPLLRRNTDGTVLTNPRTGTINVVFSDSPTLTGTVLGTNLLLSGTLGVTGHTTLTTLTGTSTATLSSLGVTGNTTVGGNLGVTGTTDLTGNTTVGGTLGVTGHTTLTTLTGTSTATLSSLGVTGNTTVGGTLGVTGVATFAVSPVITTATAGGGDLPLFRTVAGVVVTNTKTGTGDVVMSNSPTLTGTIGAANLSLSGDLGVGGNTLLTGNLGVTGNTTLTTLTGTSTATLSSLGVTGNTTVGGNLGVTGTLGVTGITTLNEDLNVVGPLSNVSIDGTLSVTGHTQVNASLGVTGPLAVTGISTLGIINASGAVTLTNGPLSVGDLAGAGNGLVFATNSGQLTKSPPFPFTLPIAQGGTNSSTPLSGQSIMISNGTAIVQGNTGAATTVLHGDLTFSQIVDADVAPAAGIVDTKLATIATAGKVSNSATTATSVNTGGAIVARDGSGNFAAGTITASLNGAATSATTATNLAGGAAGAVPYQSALNTTGFTAVGGAGQVLTSAGGGTPTWTTPTTGTVTAVSVASANGFAGTSSGGATPALTLTTSITGMLEGNGTAISAATEGTDYSLVREVADEWDGVVLALTGAQTGISTTTFGVFTLSQTPNTKSIVKMYINGVRQSNAHYSVSGTTVTYDGPTGVVGTYVALNTTDRVQFDYYY